MSTTKTKSSSVLVGAIALVSLLGGCAHTSEKALDDKLARESVPSLNALNSENKQTIEQAPGLSAEQRKELSSLRKEVQGKIASMRTESLKLRALLVKDLVAPTYDSKEVNLIKERLESVEKKRLSVIFDAVEKANTLLGHEAARNSRIVHDFFYDVPGKTF